MLKYVDLTTDHYVIPNETSLIITLCDAANKEGIPLFIRELQRILEANKNITCVLFKGADFKPALITYWTNYVFKHFKDLKIGWDSTLDTVPGCLPLQKMDYLIFKGTLYKRNYKSNCKSFKKSWYESKN